MKKYVLLVGMVVVAVVYYYLTKEARVLRIGVDCNNVPYNWEEKIQTDTNSPIANKQGSFVEGYDVQIAKLVAKRMGVEVEFKKVTWDNLFNALNRREVDAIFSGMFDTDELKKNAAFSIPYEVRKTEYAVLLNRRSKYSGAESIDDLKGSRIITQKESKFDEVINQIPNVIHISAIESQEDIVDEVLKFNVDGTIINYDTGRSYEKINPRRLKLIRFSKGNGFELGFTGLCAGVRHRDIELLKEINSAIDNITHRERQKIMDKTISKVWKNL